MTLVAADWSIDISKNIRYIGDAHGGASPSYATILEFYRWLQDLADDAVASGDDLVDITTTNPADRSTDNIITLLNGYNIDDTAAEHLYDGSVTQDDGDTIYAGLVLVGAVGAGTEPQLVQDNVLLTNYWGTGLNGDPAANIIMRIAVKVRSGGADIDGRRLRVQARELGDTYGEFSLTAGLGNNTAALFTGPDLNNQSDAATIAGWTDIVNVEGFQLIDLNNGNGPQPYYSKWDRGSRSINDLYERTKWIQRRGTAETIHGINGALFRGITHQWDYDAEASGPFVEDEIITWSGGSALLLALDDNGSAGTMWVQLLTGIAPTDNAGLTGATSGATADVDGTPVARPISAAFFGQSTGSAIIGAFGIGVEAADLTANDQLTDLLNVLQQPPNQQSFTVSGLVSGEDRVLVGPNDGADELDLDQLTADGAQSAGAGTFVVNEAIPTDTPASGTIRVFNGNSYDRVPYDSWTGSTFTLTGTLPNAVSDGANAFISYIDELAGGTTASYTAIYQSDRSLVVKVRDGAGTPIKPFKTPATFGSAGGGVTAIRTVDV